MLLAQLAFLAWVTSVDAMICLTGVLVWALWRHDYLRPGDVVTALLAVVPLGTFFVFTWVFVIGGSSNVAQVAGEEGFALWRLWFGLWPVAALLLPPVVVLAALACIVPPYRGRRWFSFAFRAMVSASAGLAMWHVMTYFPDA